MVIEEANRRWNLQENRRGGQTHRGLVLFPELMTYWGGWRECWVLVDSIWFVFFSIDSSFKSNLNYHLQSISEIILSTISSISIFSKWEYLINFLAIFFLILFNDSNILIIKVIIKWRWIWLIIFPSRKTNSKKTRLIHLGLGSTTMRNPFPKPFIKTLTSHNLKPILSWIQ